MAVILSGCGSAPPGRAPARYGLTEATEGRQVAEEAIVLVDFMLPRDLSVRLKPTWPASGLYPTLTFQTDGRAGFKTTVVTDRGFDNGLRFENAEQIPVYLVDGQDLGDVEVAFVPDGERCIFVNAQAVERLAQDFFLTGPGATEQHASYDKAHMLAFVFLHELGHLHFHDAGSYGPPAKLDVGEVGAPSGRIANREVRADRYASELVQAAWASGEMHGPMDGAYGRAMIANDLIRALYVGSNTFDFRNDPMGVLSGSAHPELFVQTGYSHLNLYVRLLVLLQQLDPTPERLQELQWLARGGGAPPNRR